MFTVIWSKTGSRSFLECLTFIKKNWPEKHAHSFVNSIYKLIDNLASGLVTCKTCHSNKKYHLCVVSKQTSLVYKIQGKKLIVVSIVDNRSDHLYQ